MTKKVSKAINLLQPEICQLLFEKEYATWIDPTTGPKFTNLAFTEKYYTETKQVEIKEEDYLQLRELGWTNKSAKSKVIEKLQEWLLTYKDYSIEDVIEACEQYTGYKGQTGSYTRSLQNFILHTYKGSKSSDLLKWVKYCKDELTLEEIAA